MSARQFKTLTLPTLLAGTARQPIDFGKLLGGAISPADPTSTLKALALTGQALRFECPAPPAEYAAAAQRKPTRRCVPDGLRARFLRLVGDGKSSAPPKGDLALAIALALERRRWQPHPFDFPRMDGFLSAHSERLGPDVCAWVDRDKSVEEKRGYFDLETLNDENWRDATPARRQKYIEDRRRADAEAARGLVESVWPDEGADIRLRLLQALRPSLSAADTPFLQGLATDRAPRVRELAERLLGRLPGAAGQSVALKSAMERITRGETGLLRKRLTLKLETPANVVGETWADWVAQAFEYFELNELAAALGLPLADMIDAAAQDQRLSTAITMMAFREGSVVLAMRTYEAMGDVPRGMDWRLFPLIQNLEPKPRQELAEFLLRKSLAADAIGPGNLSLAHRCLNGSISETLMDEILRAPVWAQWVAAQEKSVPIDFDPLAALCPPTKRPALRATLALFEGAGVRQVMQFLDLLDSLEQSEPS